ncbi:hypothetical protein YTPLAS18_36440 [Nitrospira sp.]|nr:hypothetical protein YTPLAS18_36440 [Nitrospira sp.]
MCLVSAALWMICTVAAAQHPSALSEGAARGRALYHGKGACAMCHGLDGDPARRPPMNENTTAVISKLSPPPPDLRAPDSERFLSEQQRRKAIRKGHPGTAMLPDPTLSDQDISDILAYLSHLRREPVRKTR